MTESEEANWLPLFPLQTVLFPDGVLPLRIFETRYIDMVRECMRLEKPFGVVAIREGSETGCAAEPEAVGCIAHIVEWDMEAGGLLMIRTHGGTRFRIAATRVLADNRLEAQVEHLPADRVLQPSVAHVECAKTLKLITDDFTQRESTDNEFAFPFAKPLRFDDAGWVANRWCEILPIPLKARQKLLELDDPDNRLSVIYTYLQQQKIL
jgi:Lon protease-like protein